MCAEALILVYERHPLIPIMPTYLVCCVGVCWRKLEIISIIKRGGVISIQVQVVVRVWSVNSVRGSCTVDRFKTGVRLMLCLKERKKADYHYRWLSSITQVG